MAGETGASAARVAGRAAAEVVAERDHETAALEAAVATTANKKKRWLITRFIIWCKPRSSEGWSTGFSILVALGIPAWFFLAQWHNPNYTPRHDWVWSEPPLFALLVHTIQSSILMISANQTEKSGIKDILYSLLAFGSAVVTTAVIIVLWIVGWKLGINLYHIGGFQVLMIVSVLLSTFTTFWLCGGTKWYLNRRVIANVGNTS